MARTVSRDSSGVVYAIDLDAKDKVIGVELRNIRNFTTSMVRRILPNVLPGNTSKVDFENATWAPAAAAHDMVPA